MRLDDRALGSVLAEMLACPLTIAVADGPLAPDRLSPAERAVHTGLSSPWRRREWLTGRAVLKSVLRRLGDDGDTARIRFPNPLVSLTHAAGWAVAIGAVDPNRAGIGVDLELDRTVEPGMARFFLTPSEHAWIERRPSAARAAQRLRLWTIKEALFKADPDNHGWALGDYALDHPSAFRGHARKDTGTDGRAFAYVSVRLSNGFLSLAVSGAGEFANPVVTHETAPGRERW